MPQSTIHTDRPFTFRTPRTPQRTSPRFIGSTDTSGAFDLVRQLAPLNSSLQRLASVTIQEGTNAARAEGERWAKENRTSYAKAVRDGKLPAGASVFFQEGVARQGARLDAYQFELDLITEYEESGDLQSSSPDAVAAWVDKRSADFLKGQPLGAELLQEEVSGTLNAVRNRVVERHIAEGFARREQHARDNLFRGVNSSIERYRSYDDRSVVEEAQRLGVGSDWRDVEELRTLTMAADIQLMADELYETGFRGAEINQLLSENIASRAIQENDTSLLKIMDHIQVGTGSLSGTQVGQEATLGAKDRIASNLEQIENGWWRERQRGRKVAFESAYSDMLGALNEGRTDDVNKALEVIRVSNPTAYNSARNVANKWISGSGPSKSDAATLHQIEYSLARGGNPGQQAIDEAFDAGLLTAKDHVKYTEEIRDADEDRVDFAERTGEAVFDALKPVDQYADTFIPDIDRRRRRAAELATVKANRRFKAMQREQGEISFDDAAKIRKEVIEEVTQLPWAAPLMQPNVSGSVPPLPGSEAPGGSPAADSSSQGSTAGEPQDGSQGASEGQQMDFSQIPQEAVQTLLTNLPNLTAEGAVDEISSFDAVFGDGAGKFVINNQ